MDNYKIKIVGLTRSYASTGGTISVLTMDLRSKFYKTIHLPYRSDITRTYILEHLATVFNLPYNEIEIAHYISFKLVGVKE